MIIACGSALIGLGVSIPAAYAFSRFRFPGRRPLMTAFLVINMFPIVLLIIPLFLLMRTLGLIDTFFGVILGHSTFAIPFAIWMLTSYFNAIPKDLDEAAMIDGASRFETIRFVVLPLVMPGVVTAGIYIFITSWNEYLFAMMLSGQAVRTVTVALQLFIGEFTIQWGLLTAGGTLIALPVTILFLLVQKRLVGGLTAGAVKS
jgi:multiple sugar transport system permease protein